MTEWKMVEIMRKKIRNQVCPKAFPMGIGRERQRAGSGFAAILTAAAVLVLFGGIPANPVIAAAQTTVTLTAEGNQAEAAIELSSGMQDGQPGYGDIKSLQLGFQVSILHGEGEAYQVFFIFDDEITSSVKQYSFQEETGLLQIYLSGEQNLYEGGGIRLGKIVVESAGSSDVTASIRVVKDSLKTVNDAFELQEQPFAAPGMVQVKAGVKQTEEDSAADGKADGSETENQEEETEEKAGTDTENLPGGILAPKDSGMPEQKPLLRLVRTEEQSRFSLGDFSIQGLLADGKFRISLGIAAAAFAALILGTVIRIVHNRKKKKKKWW